MSYCEIKAFKGGVVAETEEYRNAHGGSSYIWDCMFNMWLKKSPHDSWLFAAEPNPLWDLPGNPEIPLFQRAVHASTFDYAVVMRDDFKVYAGHLREFESHFGIVRDHGEVVCHLRGWAHFVEAAHAFEDVEAVGFYGMSVGEDLWATYDEEKDEMIHYDLRTGDKHFSVYDECSKAVPA